MSPHRTKKMMRDWSVLTMFIYWTRT